MKMLFSGLGGRSFGSPMPALQLEGGPGYGEHPVKFVLSLGGRRAAAGGGDTLTLFDLKDGGLKPLSTLRLPGKGACAGAWDPARGLLAVCMEHEGGIAVVRVGEDSLRLAARADDPAGGREGPRFRSAVFTSDGRLIAAHTALDRLCLYDLSPEGEIRSAESVQLPDGDGIRELLLREDSGRLYATTEQTNAVMAFSFDGGTPALLGKTPSLTPDYAMPSHQGSLCADRAGKFLYVSNRGANTVTVFKTGAGTPTGLARVAEAPVCGDYPRRALLTPDGTQMVCMNQRSNSVTILPVGPDGIPGMPTRVLPFMHPSDVAFVEA